MKQTYVIYHKADLDGLVWARACTYRPEVTDFVSLIPMQYGDNFEEALEKYSQTTSLSALKWQRVLMVDFSLPPETMERLNENTEFYRFDHHISAIKDNEHLDIKGARDTTKAGCRLAFNHRINPKSQIPKDIFSDRVSEAIDHISLYDTRTKNDPVWNRDENILPYQYGFRLEAGLDLAKVSELMIKIEHQPETNATLVIQWRNIIKYNKQQRESWMKKSGDVEIWVNLEDAAITGNWKIQIYKWLALFWPAGGSSQVFESKWDNTVYDVMVYITYNINKKEYTVSLYSDKDNIDCSVIAKSFWGGGHKWAAGFVCKELPFTI